MPVDIEPVHHDRVICPTCHTADFEPLDAGEFPAVRCRACRLGIERHLTAEPLVPYSRKEYDSRREHGRGTPAWSRFHHDVAVAELRLKQLRDHNGLPAPEHTGAWVDVGCNTGAHLVQARRRGWAAVGGVELDSAFCEEVAQVIGVSVVPYRLWLAQAGSRRDQTISVVSFFDVLEHILDPAAAVRTAAASVAVHGVVVVEAPDLDACADAEAFRAWRHRRVTREFTEHLWYFCETAVHELFKAYAGRGRRKAFYRPVPGRFCYVWEKESP